MKLTSIFFFSFFSLYASAQKEKVSVKMNESFPKDFSALPIKPARTVSFTTEEASYIDLDLSPDGKTLVCSFLGELFTIPVTGGNARQLTRGLAINMSPCWSPDGKYIAYLSDATGKGYLHILNSSGSFHKVFGGEGYQTEVLKSIWLPDSKGLIANGRTIYIVSDVKNESKELNDLSNIIGFSEDSRFIYYVCESKNSIQLMMLDRNTGQWLSLFDFKGKLNSYEMRSLKVSPDGRWLSYIKGEGSHISRSMESLLLVDLKNNVERSLVNLNIRYGPAKDHNYCYSKDSKFIFIGYGGKIHQINIETEKNIIIPFVADVKIDMGPLNYNTFRVSFDSFQVKYIGSVSRGPGGKQIVFSALNRVYIKDLPNGVPRVLARQNAGQFQPSYSPDGKWISYVTWKNYEERGHVWRIRCTGGSPEQITTVAGTYLNPSWSPDGKMIIVAKGNDKSVMAKENVHQIQVISLDNKSVRVVVENVPLLNHPKFTDDNKGIVYKANKFDIKTKAKRLIVYQDLNGDNEKVILSAKTNDEISSEVTTIKYSPDVKYTVFGYNDNLYLVSLAGSTIAETGSVDTLPKLMIRFARGASSPSWEDGGRILSWVEANNYCRIDPNKIIRSAQGRAPNKSYAGLPESNIIDVEPLVEIVNMNLKISPLHNKGIIALTNVRIITMYNNEVIENGTIIIKDGRFTYVGRSDRATISKGSKIINLRGKSIIPGLIDMHNHMRTNAPPGVFPQQTLDQQITLSYGITTIRDPFASLFANSELIEDGQMTGPRAYSAGGPIQAGRKLTSLDEAKIIVNNRTKMGANIIKQYYLNTRLERQLLLLACNDAGVNMTNEAEDNPLYWLGQIKDGSTGIEHNPSWGNIYNDFKILFAKSGTYTTPTMQTGVVDCKNYFGSKYVQSYLDLNSDLIPADRKIILQKGISNSKPDTGFLHISRINAAFNKAGGKIMMGSHGEYQGIGAHYELWALQMGGLSNYETLKTATITAAEGLGVQKDLGSIEVGKIADLIILDKNPLEDIRNTISIKYVMKAGVLYNKEIIKEMVGKKKKENK